RLVRRRDGSPQGAAAAVGGGRHHERRRDESILQGFNPRPHGGPGRAPPGRLSTRGGLFGCDSLVAGKDTGPFCTGHELHPREGVGRAGATLRIIVRFQTPASSYLLTGPPKAASPNCRDVAGPGLFLLTRTPRRRRMFPGAGGVLPRPSLPARAPRLG